MATDTIDLTTETALVAAREIRTMAVTILNRFDTRQNHPSYGVTKASLRTDLDRLNGAVALYAVLTGQANFTSAPNANEPAFAHRPVARYVARARALVRSL